MQSNLAERYGSKTFGTGRNRVFVNGYWNPQSNRYEVFVYARFPFEQGRTFTDRADALRYAAELHRVISSR